MDPRLLENFKKIYRHVGMADYKKALALSSTTLKKFPESIEAYRVYATILADTADYLRPKNAQAMKRDAIRRLKSLTKRLRGQPIEFRGAVRNEYFYHSQQYKKQFDLGVSLVKAGDKTSYFSQGVGAAWHSYELKRRNHHYRARKWASKSISAWRQYLKIEPNYYNSYVHLALAHGVLGDSISMENALREASSLSKKPEKYFEFEKIRVLISALL